MSKLKMIKIKDFLELITDYHSNGSYETLKKNVQLLDKEDYAIIIRTLNFERNDFKKEVLYVTKEAYNFLKKSYVLPNDILMNKISNAGSIYLMPNIEKPVTCGMNLFVLRFNNKVNQRYMFYNMKNVEDYIKNFSHGTTTTTITKEEVKNIILHIHDRKEQDKIEYILTALDNKIELNNKMNSELENMAKTIYDYWFLQFEFPNDEGKPYKSSGGKMIWNEELKKEIPEGWEVNKLEKYIKLERGISYTSKNIENKLGIPMINLASIDINKNYRPNELKFYEGKYNSQKEVFFGEMLIACTDLTRNADIIGSPILVPNDKEKYIYSMDLVKINLTDININPYYLYMR